jgi:dCMP deaminase
MMNWNEYFMAMARFVAQKSKDPSVKVGVVIVGPDNEVRSTGYNGFPRGIDDNDPNRWDRPAKYQWVEHAERNAVYNAARIGVSTKNCTAYMESPPCADCARALIQAGIMKVVVTTNNPFKDRADWKQSIQFAMDLLAEAGVQVDWTNL